METMGEDPLLPPPNSDPVSLFPIRYPKIWEMYKKAEASFWTVESVDLSGDIKHWNEILTGDERRFVSHVLAFFAASDGIVLENIALRFMSDVKIPEARAFYGFQIAIENIHSEMYSLLLETFVKDPVEKHRLFHSMDTIPCVARKAQWALQWIDLSESFAQRIVAFACVEGIFFSGSFCCIYWLKNRGLMPGLAFANEMIARDEGLHCDFAVLIYNLLHEKLSQDQIHCIVSQAVDIEKEFICEAPPCALIGINVHLMGQYIEFMSDGTLVALGYGRMYLETNPFDWMDLISLRGKTNFLERSCWESQKACMMASLKDNGIAGGGRVFDFNVDSDF
ncbi:Ribonucleoside-diphosphate reductase small chain C [Platanthera guangdongensis]|uniref:Ribonucleoside-diphosphate reductase small chain C n=1 Tax=Platanthera guangdongensis TaxID=2320717 RepID=A0ABR2LWG4_9ASPA